MTLVTSRYVELAPTNGWHFIVWYFGECCRYLGTAYYLVVALWDLPIFWGSRKTQIYSNAYNDMMNLLVMACEWDCNCKYIIKIINHITRRTLISQEYFLAKLLSMFLFQSKCCFLFYSANFLLFIQTEWLRFWFGAWFREVCSSNTKYGLRCCLCS